MIPSQPEPVGLSQTSDESARSRCFICGEDMEGVGTREIVVLGSLRVEACGPCVDLPDTDEFVNRLIAERLMPQEA